MNQAEWDSLINSMQGSALSGGFTSGSSVPGVTVLSSPSTTSSGSTGTLGLNNSSAPSGGGSGGSAPLNQAAINATQASIDELPGILQRALAAEQTSYGNTRGRFDAQEQAQRGTYDKSTVTNQQNYDSNLMASVRAGIQGLGGLMSLLRGAARGTAGDLARDAVSEVTSNDIRTGADTQKENQTALDSTLNTFLTDLRGKRDEAADTFENNQRALRRDSDTQLQDLYAKMAGFYSDAGNTTAAADWINRSAGLTPRIAENSSRQVSKYDTSPIEVSAPELTAFADPTQPNVTTVNDGRIGTGIFTADNRRKRELAPVGA